MDSDRRREALQRYRIVLCRPKTSGNIGFACRAMKTMGIHELAIVGDPAAEDRRAVLATAVHAADVYEGALRFSTVQEATADCVLVAGTTRRRGKGRKRAVMLPEEFAERAESVDGRVAVLFGNEETGLTSEELSHCSTAVSIPTDDAFPSLNLSHAVQIVCYVIYQRSWGRPSYTPVSAGRVDAAVESIIDHLDALNHFGHADVGPTRTVLHDVIGRAAPTEREVRELERIFRRLRHRER